MNRVLIRILKDFYISYWINCPLKEDYIHICEGEILIAEKIENLSEKNGFTTAFEVRGVWLEPHFVEVIG